MCVLGHSSVQMMHPDIYLSRSVFDLLDSPVMQGGALDEAQMSACQRAFV